MSERARLLAAKRLRRRKRILEKQSEYIKRLMTARPRQPEPPRTIHFPNAKLNFWQKLKLKFHETFQKA